METDYDQKSDDEYRREIETRFQERIIKRDLQGRVKLAIVMETNTREYWVIKFCGRQFELELKFYKQFGGTKFCLPFRQCNRRTGTIFTKYEPGFVDLKTLYKQKKYKPTSDQKKENFELFLQFLKEFLFLCGDERNGVYIDYTDIHKNPSNIGFNVETKEFVFFEGGNSQQTYSDVQTIGNLFLKSMADSDQSNMLVYRYIFPTKLIREAYNNNNFTKTKKLKEEPVLVPPPPPQPDVKPFDCKKTLPNIEMRY